MVEGDSRDGSIADLELALLTHTQVLRPELHVAIVASRGKLVPLRPKCDTLSAIVRFNLRFDLRGRVIRVQCQWHVKDLRVH